MKEPGGKGHGAGAKTSAGAWVEEGNGDHPHRLHVGEVIEADTRRLVAECPRLYAAPPFGSFVRVEGSDGEAPGTHEVGGRSGGPGRRGDGANGGPFPRPVPPSPRLPVVFAVVAHIATAAVDAGRRTQALNLPPERLAERMPQLELVLRTCFTALVVGYEESGIVRPYLPPRPPEIHRFVHACTPGEVEALTRGAPLNGAPDFLRVLAAAPDAPVEDVLAAAILHATTVRGAGAPADAFLIECGKAVAALFRREPDRFQSVMRRLQAARRATAGAPWEQPLMR